MATPLLRLWDRLDGGVREAEGPVPDAEPVGAAAGLGGAAGAA
jgi:hypothetical protein